jgi:hypothetical protein
LYSIAVVLIIGGIVWFFWPDRLEAPSAKAQSSDVKQKLPLTYLRHEDSELGSAVRQMAWQSAWGKWFAAQHLVLTGKPITEPELLNTASHLVGESLVNGELEIRGRLPGSMDYQEIPQTHWRSSALHFVPDSMTRWRLTILPRGGATIAPDGTVEASDPVAEERNASILNYDSLIVNARDFEKLCPRRDHITDKKRRQFLRAARRRHLNEDEIQRLSQD